MQRRQARSSSVLSDGAGFFLAGDVLPPILFLETKAFEGAQLKYTWRELEREKDAYDFSAIQHDLAFLSSNGKKLFIQLQDSSFDPTLVHVPRYLLSDARYKNPKTGQQIAIAELAEFATEYLKVDYIFWCNQEPFYSQKLIPFLQAQR